MPHSVQPPPHNMIPHSMIPQPQSHCSPFPNPSQQAVNTTTLPMMPPAIPTTSYAPLPRPGLHSGPLPTQHVTPPPLPHPGTSPQHSHNNPVTHTPIPTASTGPAAPYNFTMPVHPAPTPQPAPDLSQPNNDNTAQATTTPGPTMPPTPTTHTQQPNPSHTRRSRTPLSRRRRSRRSRQRRSSRRSTRRRSAPRRRQHRHHRSRSTRSRSAHTRRRLASRPSIPSPRSRRGSRRRTPTPTSSPSPRTSPSPTPRIRLQPANILRQQFQRVALTMRAANAGPRRNPPPPPPPKASKAPSQQHSHTHSDNPPQTSNSQQPFNVFSSPLPPCIEVRPAAEVPQDQRLSLHSYDIQDAERLIEKIREICGDSAVDGFTSDQLLAMSQMLHSAGYVPNDRGIEAIRWVEIDSLYPAMVISLHDPDLFQDNSIPFRAPPPFGVTASEWQTNPPAVNCYTFVHGTSFQAGAGILREGLLRPTALRRSSGTRAIASVVYGAATPGDISDYTVQTATAQLLKRPKGRNDIILLCTLATTEAHYKASWSSLTDEAHVCRRRGILRNSDRWGAHAGHLHVQGLIMVGHNR